MTTRLWIRTATAATVSTPTISGLVVRFKDGLEGRVQLRREELTGVLAPSVDERFFEQVFVDHGAVAWPGEIDLAPDAMHAEVARRSREPQKLGALR